MFDETLGGSFVSAVIAKHIVKTSKVDISSNKKALGKAMSQAEKVKYILSANKDSPISIEGLDGDYDYSGYADSPAATAATAATAADSAAAAAPLTCQRRICPAIWLYS